MLRINVNLSRVVLWMNLDTKTHSQTTGQQRRGVGQRGARDKAATVLSCAASISTSFVAVVIAIVITSWSSARISWWWRRLKHACSAEVNNSWAQGLTQADGPEEIDACTRKLNTDSVHHVPKEISKLFSAAASAKCSC